MGKRYATSSLGRTTAHRLAMLRNMVTSLIIHERITTTLPKAKAVRKLAENMVTHAKKGNLHHRRLAAGVVREKGAVKKLFDVLGPRYENRPGGYTRILKLATPRHRDKADMAVIEYVDRLGELRPAREVWPGMQEAQMAQGWKPPTKPRKIWPGPPKPKPLPEAPEQS